MAQTTEKHRERPDAIPWQKRPFLRIDLAIELTGLSRSTLYRLAGKGEITLRRLGGRVVVETAGVRALLDGAEVWRPSNRGAAARAAAAQARRAASARMALR